MQAAPAPPVGPLALRVLDAHPELLDSRVRP